MKHDDLQHSLAAHLRGAGDRMVWENTQLGPAGSPRPDVFTVNKSYSRFRTDAYECKVSISDLRSDVTSGKWQSYRKFAHSVWFAMPRGMAPLELIPKECGIILMGEGGAWRAQRKPVAQVHDTLPRDMWLKLLIESFPDWPQSEVRSRRADDYMAEQIVRKKLGDDLARLFADVKMAESSLRYRKEGLEKELADIRERAEHARRTAQSLADAERARLDDACADLAEQLGLDPKESRPADLSRAINIFRRQLQGREIDQAIQALTALRGSMPAANDAGKVLA